eukprot:jgi/Psemu1/323189/estExt_fgenesh1_pg.C_600009
MTPSGRRRQEEEEEEQQDEDKIIESGGGSGGDGLSLSHTGGACDESKCVSRGLSHLYNHSFTCYGDNKDFSMMCADGYLPRVVEDEPLLTYFRPLNEPIIFLHVHPDDFVPSRFEGQPYVCCDFDFDSGFDSVLLSNDGNSNANANANANTTLQLDDDATATATAVDDAAELLFLRDTECVPYRSEFYEEAKVLNFYGNILPVTLEVQESRIVPESQLDADKDADVVVATGVDCSGGQQQQHQQQHQKGDGGGGSQELWRRDSFRRSTSSTMSLTMTRAEPAFSSYNLYLVYLAIPDLFMSVYELGMSSSMIRQKFNPGFYSPVIYTKLSIFTHEWAINLAYAISAILYINAFVSYEVLKLLRSFNEIRRVKPPSVTTVTVQSLCVYALAIAVAVVDTYIRKEARREFLNGNKERSGFLLFVTDLYWYVFMFVPIIFITCVCATIFWRRYLPSVNNSNSSNGGSPRERALRELVWYFARIVAVIFGLWFPFILLALCVGPIGSLVTTSVILTQSNVRKYVWRLITLTYLRDYYHSCRERRANYTNTNNHRSNNVADDDIVVATTAAGRKQHVMLERRNLGSQYVSQLSTMNQPRTSERLVSFDLSDDYGDDDNYDDDGKKSNSCCVIEPITSSDLNDAEDVSETEDNAKDEENNNNNNNNTNSASNGDTVEHLSLADASV